MDNLLIPAIIAGIFTYLGAIEGAAFFGITGFYTLGRPLVAGLVLGIAFGDITTGVLAGVAVQGVFIANLTTGGATNSEITYASYGGIGLALASANGDPAIAVTLAVLIGQTFGLIFHNTRMAAYSFFNNRAQTAAEELDYKGITKNHVIYPQIATFLIRAVPVTLAIYFGSGFVENLLEIVPETITDIIGVLGGVLPALGIGMLMNIVIKDSFQFIFFFVGFTLVAFAGLDIIPVVFIAALVAYVVYLASGKSNGQTATDNGLEEFEDSDLF